ncbi:MAG: amino acid adenylation domain-containing protein [bacterium]|nr:amino acid adenylation domain-containing protein [bacterium]
MVPARPGCGQAKERGQTGNGENGAPREERGQAGNVENGAIREREQIEDGLKYQHKDIGSREPAYITYTSGSTGRPKGVVVEHRSAVNILFALQQSHPHRESDTYILKSSYGFDISIIELFGWYWEGGRLAVLERGGEKNPLLLIDAIQRETVTHITFVPSMFSILADLLTHDNIESVDSLEFIILGGEELPPQVVERFSRRNKTAVLLNIYGPTEATVYATSYPLPHWKGGLIPIGKTVPNARVYILNNANKLQPFGVPGQLCIGGAGLTRGYLNNPQLTSEKFITIQEDSAIATYSQSLSTAPGGQILYLTGDLARYLVDGNIEYLGRLDHQVKIRGFRIELGEIQDRLMQHVRVKEAVVTNGQKGGDAFLCAYFVPIDTIGDEAAFIDGLRLFLTETLPKYMVPQCFIQMDALPLNSAGKVDRKALPPAETISTRQYVPPRNKTDDLLISIWAGILGLEENTIGIDDNFFRIGGHSLKTVQLATRVHKEFDVSVPLRDLFRINTVRGLSDYLENWDEEQFVSIKRTAEKPHYPLTPGQKRFFFIQEPDPDNLSYHMVELLRIKGRPNKEKFEKFFKQLIRRHESLRTTYMTAKGEPVQVIHPDIPFEITRNHISAYHTVGGDSEGRIKDIARRFVQPFDLGTPPLIRAELIQMEEADYILAVDMHHITSDGTSTGIFINDFMELYKGNALPPLKLQYRDYADWLTEKRERQKQKEAKETDGMEEYLSLELPTDFPGPADPGFDGESLCFQFSREETAALQTLALEEDVTLFMLLLSIFNVFLGKLCRRENIVVGSPIAGRVHYDLHPIVGLFINTLVLRNYPATEKSFSVFLQEVKATSIDAFRHQEHQYDDVLEKSGLCCERGRNPLFDVMFVLQNMDMPLLEFPDIVMWREKGIDVSAKFDLTLYTEVIDGILECKMEYRTRLFTKETIGRFIDYFKTITAALLKKPDREIGSIEMVTGEERRRILYDFNDTRVPYPADKTVYGIIEEQSERTPGAIALRQTRQEPGTDTSDMLVEITYRELMENSNRLARTMRKKGVQTGSIVAVMMERSIDTVIGIQAVLKAGGAYVPIDPEYPDNRILAMLENSGASFLLSTGTVIEEKQLESPKQEFLLPDRLQDELKTESPENLEHKSGPGDLIYIIFTSGSTGTPKGAGVYHRGFMNLLYWFVTEFKLEAKDSNLWLTSLSFDLTQKNLYAPLMKGATLCVPTLNYFEPRSLLREIRDYRITWLNCTPGMFYKMVEYEEAGEEKKLAGLRLVFLGGEPILFTTLIGWLESEACHARIVNTYGPTECTDICASYLAEEPRRFLKETLPVGNSIYNVRMYIPDKNLHPLPVGVPGELLIGGAGVGIGYVNDKEKTATKFIRHSFEEGQPAQMLFRTGDLVKWRNNGTVEFIGRIDHQVKVRGFRIELGEIENRLATHDNIKEVLVLARDDQDKGDKYLCAYMVPADAEKFNEEEVRHYLAADLPDYMVPAFFVPLEKMPLNPNGKVDRNALPVPDKTVNAGYVPPANDREHVLAALWAEVLGMEVESIGVNDNFFRLGGHSLIAAGLMGKIHKAFSVEIPIAELFANPTIRGICLYLDSPGDNPYTAPALVEEKEYYPLSSAQKRLYILQHMDEQGTGYNIPFAMELEGELDGERFEATFHQLIQRHESLRTSFFVLENEEEDEPVQVLHIDPEFRIEYRDMSQLQVETPAGDSAGPCVSRSAIMEMIRPFDLQRAPLLRVYLIKTGPRHHILLFDMHHIISDGISINVITREFTTLYAAHCPKGKRGSKGPATRGRKGLPFALEEYIPPRVAGPPEALSALKLRYRDYAGWQERRKAAGEIKAQESYWLKEFAGELPVPDLPIDFPRPAVRDFAGGIYSFALGSKDTAQLRALAFEKEVSLFMVLVAVFSILIAKLTRQDEVVIGSPIAGRRHTDLEAVVGMFVNTVAIRCFPVGNKTFPNYLEEIKTTILEAFENQDFQFEELVEALDVPRDMSRNPLFDVMLVVRNMERSDVEIPGLKIKPYELETGVSKFDLTLLAVEESESLAFSIEYCSALFKPETIAGFAAYFKQLLHTFLCPDNTKTPTTIASADSTSDQYDDAYDGDFDF